MRLLKVLSTVVITVLAVLVGLLTALAVTIGGAITYLVSRLLRRVKTSPVRAQPHASRAPPDDDGDVIDITATEITEVPADHATR